MAKRDPQFPERSSGSLLKAAIAVTPLTVGVAAALRGVHVDGSLKQPREAGIDQAIRQLAKNNRRGPHVPSIEDVNKWMNSGKGPTADVSRKAWQWATQVVDPFTRKKMLQMTKNLTDMTDVELRSAIASTISSNDSVAMSRIWQRYERNVNLLQRQAKIGMPVFAAVEDIGRFAQPTLIPLATPIPPDFTKGIKRVAEAMGSDVRAVPYGITRPEIASEGLGAWNVTFQGTQLGNIRIQVPQVSGGIMLQGAELQTRRIAPDFVIMGEGGELTRISRPEMFLRELEEGIAPEIGGRLKTERDIEQAIKQLRIKTFGEIEATPNVLLEERTAAAAQREALRGMGVEMVAPVERAGKGEYRSGFRQLTDDEIAKTMISSEGRAMGLRGGVSPKGLAEGRLSTAEWERFYIGPPEYGRRPEQSFREFQITEESMREMGQYKPGQKYRALQMRGDRLAYEMAARPRLKTVYIDPEMHRAAMEAMAIGEGEVIIRARIGDKMIFEESVTKKLIEARRDIAAGGIMSGEILGVTSEGIPYALPEGAEITAVRRAGQGEISVEMLRRHQFAHGGKLFGGAKALALFREEGAFRGALEAFGAGDADVIASMDELKKNRALHRRQMVDSLQGVIERRIGDPSTPAQMRFMSDPFKAGQKWAALSTRGGVFSHQAFTARAMRFAVQGMGVTPAEFGEAFGAVPFVMGEEKAGGVVSAMVRQAMPAGIAARPFETALGAGIAAGMPEFAYGGPMVDVGGLGSLEPRAFDILKAGPMGPLGVDVGEELMQRLAATTPEAVIAHEEIRKSLATLSGAGGIDLAGAKVFGARGETFQQFLEKGGGVIRSAGVDDIYVPGMDVMKQLRPYETRDFVARSILTETYENIAAKVGAAEEGLITQEEMRRSLAYHTNVLRREWAPAGKGAGAVSRGKVLGSRFLRGVSAQRVGGAATAIREAGLVGITSANFQQMWDEMARLIDTGQVSGTLAELEEMSKAFYKGGEVGGMLARHPFLGAFSMQPVRMKMIEGRSNLIVVPEITKNIRIATEVGGAFQEKTISLGPLVGLAGDKDADAYSAMLMGPRNEEKVRKAAMLQDSEYARQYTQHQVRMQLFKAGKPAAGAGVTPLKEMMAEVEKLSVGQKWIAPLSLEMTAAKRALARFGQGAAAADARFLLEWLEQTPISAKHLAATETAGGGLASTMMSITDAMQERSTKLLEGNIATIVKDDMTAKAMLQGNVYLDAESAKDISKVTGTKMSRQIQGLDVGRGVSEMMRTLNEADRTGFTRTAELMAGRGARVKMREIAELTAKSAFKGLQEAPGMMKKVSSAFTEATNKMSALGAGLIRHHKTIGLGFAGTLALGAILSDPPKTVGPGRGKIPDARLNMNRRKAANRMRPEDLHPATQDVSAPTPPQMMRNQTVRLTMNNPGTGARIRARAHAGANLAGVSSSFAGISRNTSVNIRDNRSSLSSHEIASKLM